MEHSEDVESICCGNAAAVPHHCSVNLHNNFSFLSGEIPSYPIPTSPAIRNIFKFFPEILINPAAEQPGNPTAPSRAPVLVFLSVYQKASLQYCPFSSDDIASIGPAVLLSAPRRLRRREFLRCRIFIFCVLFRTFQFIF